MTQAMLAVHVETKKRVIRLQAKMMERYGKRVIIDEVLVWLLDNSKL